MVVWASGQLDRADGRAAVMMRRRRRGYTTRAASAERTRAVAGALPVSVPVALTLQRGCGARAISLAAACTAMAAAALALAMLVQPAVADTTAVCNNARPGLAAQSWNQLVDEAAFGGREGFRVKRFVRYGVPGLLLVGGNGDKHVNNDAFFSEDGATWVKVADGQFSARSEFGMAVSAGYAYVVAGSYEPDSQVVCYHNDVLRTADGSTYEVMNAGVGPKCSSIGKDPSLWTGQVPDPNTGAPMFSPREDVEAVPYNGALWVYGGEDAVKHYNDCWRSTDFGRNWTLMNPSAAWGEREDHRIVIFNELLWLFAGENDTTIFNDVYWSNDGADWNAVALPPWPTREDLDATTALDRVWVVGGGNSEQGLPDLWWSQSPGDATSWVRASADSCWGRRFGMSIIQLHDRLLLIAGTIREPQADVWQSPPNLLCMADDMVCGNAGTCSNHTTCTCNADLSHYANRNCGPLAHSDVDVTPVPDIDDGASPALVALIVLVVLFGGFIAGVVRWLWKPMLMAKGATDHYMPAAIGGGADSGGGGDDGDIDNILPSLQANTWHIPFSQVTIARKIGAGGAGQVWIGTFNGAEVALKQLYANMIDESDLDDIRSEATLLSRIRHPHVVHFYGVCFRRPDIYIVTEFCSGGSTHELLVDKSKPLPMKTVVKIASQLAQGMAYLHSQGILHRDLKPENVLLDKAGEVRICDLGLARVADRGPMTVNKGTPAFMAPETMTGASSSYSGEVDVYSFAIWLWCMVARDLPYKDIGIFAIAGKVITEGLRPEIPDSCPTGLAKLIKQCWDADTRRRPNFAQICDRLADPAIAKMSHTQAVLRMNEERSTTRLPTAGDGGARARSASLAT